MKFDGDIRDGLRTSANAKVDPLMVPVVVERIAMKFVADIRNWQWYPYLSCMIILDQRCTVLCFLSVKA